MPVVTSTADKTAMMIMVMVQVPDRFWMYPKTTGPKAAKR